MMKSPLSPDDRMRADLGNSYAGSLSFTGYEPRTMGDYLDMDAANLGMAWSYDSARDAVILDFPWHKPDARPASELTAALGGDPNSTWQKDAVPWQRNFNALLSAPGNFEQLGKCACSPTASRHIFPIKAWS